MLFKLTMRHKSAPSYSTVSIGFPADEPELHTLMARIGVGITTEKLCLVDAVENEHHALRALTGKLVNADEVQYLARRMDGFDKNELSTFYAAAEYEKLTEVKDLIRAQRHFPYTAPPPVSGRGWQRQAPALPQSSHLCYPVRC